MASIRKNRLWKELYVRALDNNLEILQDKDWENIFQDIIIEHLSTGIDPMILLAHRNNNLPSVEKTKEFINKEVEIILENIKQKEEETPVFTKKAKKDKKQ